MAKNDNLKDFLTDVADAIREKKGTTDAINPQDFSSEIASIQSGGRDWSEIGYDAEPSFIDEGFEYAKEIIDNFDNTKSSYRYYFQKLGDLIFSPSLVLPNATDLVGLFYAVPNLLYIDKLVAPECIDASALCFTSESLHTINYIYLPKVESLANAFSGTDITKFNADWTTHVITWDSCFANCSKLRAIDLDMSSATNARCIAQNTPLLEDVLLRNVENILSYHRAFQSSGIEHLHKLNSPKMTDISNMFYLSHKLKIIEELNFSSVENTSAFCVCNSLVYMFISNLGKSTLTTYNFSDAKIWGTGSDENRQSLIDSLITYSYDRASNGMATATIKLSATTKALLTEEEIAQITAKGFTIA